MAKKTDANSLPSVDFKDLEDLGYQQAGTFETSVEQARYAMAQIPGFPEEVSDEARTKLYAGYRRRFSQKNPAVVYAIINDHYVVATQDQITNNAVEKANIGVDYAYSFTQQEFGKLANTQPALHKLIKDIRDKTSTYCSNRLGDLKRSARKILDAGKERKRSSNKNFSEFIDAFFSDARTRLTSAKSRGDKTADEARFNKAVTAFMTAWRHGA